MELIKHMYKITLILISTDFCIKLYIELLYKCLNIKESLILGKAKKINKIKDNI